MDLTMDQAQPPQFAIVSMYGHQRVAGAISSHTVGGATFVRVDVPEVQVCEVEWTGDDSRTTTTRTIPSHTKLLGANAIFSIDYCDEAAALAAAMSIKHQPVNPYAVAKALASIPADIRDRLLPSATAQSPAPAAESAQGHPDDDIPY